MRKSLLAIALLAATAPPTERIVSDTTLATRIGDVPMRLLIDPGAPAMPLLTQEAALRAGLKGGPFGLGYRVGPELVEGRSALGRIALAGVPEPRRIGWVPRPYAAGFDGVIGPGGLPEPVVRFVLRPERPGERTIALPLDEEGGLLGHWGASNAVVDVGGVALKVRFSLRREETVATAGAALTLAAAFGGTLDAGRDDAEIAFGVRRPVRTLRLARAFRIGSIALTELRARTADFGNADGIAATGAAADPDEVVVTAKGKRDRRHDRISIGRAALAGCSSLTFDRPARQVRLTCS